jgi:glycosyltransferase involved in cell wall biosynthesis
LIEVTVVIPTYNREKVIRRALDSLVKQTYKNFEVIVGDDGSTDNTESVINEYIDKLNLSYYWIENFGGPARARNLGIEKAKGKYIAFLDSDDWWNSEKLKWSVYFLDNGYDLVYHNLFIAKSEHQLIYFKKTRSVQYKFNVFDELLWDGNTIINSSVVVRKDILNIVGKINEDEETIFWEDYDYWLRIAKVTNKFKKINKTLGYYAVDTGYSSSNEKIIRNAEAFSKRYVTNHAPWWVTYRKAIAYYKMKRFKESKTELSKTITKSIRHKLILCILNLIINLKLR